MKIAVHHLSDTPATSFSYRWIEYLKKSRVEVLTLNFKDRQSLSQIKTCDGAMWHWYHQPDDKQTAPKILQAIELGLKIPVFPNLNSAWHFDEKISQYYLLSAINAPLVPTYVFYDYAAAENFLRTARYPLVFKLSVGAGSANIIKIDHYPQGKNLLHRMFSAGIEPYTFNEFQTKFSLKRLIRLSAPQYYLVQKNYFYLQDYLPNPHDIRITVIGDRAFGFTRINRDKDFRASGSGRIEYDLSKIPLEAVKIAFDISRKMKFQSMAYDFLYDAARNLLINEFSYGYMSQAVFDCPGHWDHRLRWHPGHLYPEQAHVDDFINLIKHHS